MTHPHFSKCIDIITELSRFMEKNGIVFRIKGDEFVIEINESEVVKIMDNEIAHWDLVETRAFH